MSTGASLHSKCPEERDFTQFHLSLERVKGTHHGPQWPG